MALELLFDATLECRRQWVRMIRYRWLGGWVVVAKETLSTPSIKNTAREYYRCHSEGTNLTVLGRVGVKRSVLTKGHSVPINSIRWFIDVPNRRKIKNQCV